MLSSIDLLTWKTLNPLYLFRKTIFYPFDTESAPSWYAEKKVRYGVDRASLLCSAFPCYTLRKFGTVFLSATTVRYWPGNLTKFIHGHHFTGHNLPCGSTFRFVYSCFCKLIELPLCLVRHLLSLHTTPTFILFHTLSHPPLAKNIFFFFFKMSADCKLNYFICGIAHSE